MGRYCLECGLILRGRTDKKFCGDHCRGHYNNMQNKNRYSGRKAINNILGRNAGILEKLLKNGVTQLHLQTLASIGFDFNYFTHLHTDGGTVCYCCYTFAYIKINEKELILKEIKIPSTI